MKKISLKILIGLTLFVYIIFLGGNFFSKAVSADSQLTAFPKETHSKDQVIVSYTNNKQNINLIKQPILLSDQLSSDEQNLFKISNSQIDEGIVKIKEYVTSSNGIIKNLKVSSKEENVQIKSLIPLFSSDDVKNIVNSNGFNLQILVRLSNWEEFTFSVPVVIEPLGLDYDSTPLLQFESSFLLNQNIPTSDKGYSLVSGISALVLDRKKQMKSISSKDWKITSTNGNIINNYILDVSKAGDYIVNYEIKNPNSEKTTKISRKISVFSETKKDDNYTPIGQTRYYPVDKIGIVNYVPNYGIMLYNDFGNNAIPLNRYLPDGSQWKVLYSVFDEQGEEWYCLGRKQWVKQKYIKINSDSDLSNVNFIATVKNESGAKLYNGYGDYRVFSGRILASDSQWKVFKTINLYDGSIWYNLGANQWVNESDLK